LFSLLRHPGRRRGNWPTSATSLRRSRRCRSRHLWRHCRPRLRLTPLLALQQISDRILPRDALRSSGRWRSGRWSWPDRHGLAGNIVKRHHTANPRRTARQALASGLQRDGIGDDHLPTIRFDSQRQLEHRLRNLELGTDSNHRVANT
jgi:hypothetical protein